MYGQNSGAAQVPGAQAQLTYDFNNHEGWQQIFDGRTLNGWDGSKDVWRVENGVIVGESTVEHPTIWWVTPSDTGTAWLILHGKLKNFEFKTEIKLGTKTTNSGIQFRATRLGAIPDAEYAAQLKKHFGDGGPPVKPNNTGGRTGDIRAILPGTPMAASSIAAWARSVAWARRFAITQTLWHRAERELPAAVILSGADPREASLS